MSQYKYTFGAMLSVAFLSSVALANTEFKVVCATDEDSLNAEIKSYHLNNVSAPSVSTTQSNDFGRTVICVTIEGSSLVRTEQQKSKGTKK